MNKLLFPCSFLPAAAFGQGGAQGVYLKQAGQEDRLMPFVSPAFGSTSGGRTLVFTSSSGDASDTATVAVRRP